MEWRRRGRRPARRPLLAKAFKTGPPPGVTGGFGEPTCHACHFDHPINAPGGSLRLVGLPESYTAGARYSMRVGLTRRGTQHAGFQIAVRFADGPGKGHDAGVLEPGDARVEIVSSREGRPHYAQHTSAGPPIGDRAETDWSVIWTAPADGRWPVTAHIAATAGNGDDSPLGDFVYLKEVRSRPR